MLGVTVNLLGRPRLGRRPAPTWVNLLVPGRPEDTSAEGRASQLFGSHADLSDPVAAFDRAVNPYVAGIAFDRVKPADGDG